MAAKMLEVLKQILDELDAFVYVTDFETDELLFANRNLRQTFNIDADPAGRTCWSVLQSGMTGRCPFCAKTRLQQEPAVPVIWEGVNTSNNRVYRNRDSIIEWTDNRLAHLQYAVDITSTVEQVRELREDRNVAELMARMEADARAHAMLDATPLATSFWDEEGKMIDCNMEAVRMFGLEVKEDYINHFYDLNPEYQPDGELTSTKAAREIDLAFDCGYRCFEWLYLTGSGEPLPVETTLVRVPWKGGYRLAAFSRDLREIRASEAKRRAAEENSMKMELQAKVAIEANLAKSHFLSNMSHEIRTPMNAIIGLADLLSDEELTEKQRGFVRNIQTSSTTLLGIINDILDISKIESGKLELHPVNYDLQLLLANIKSMFSLLADNKHISFSMDISSEVPRFCYGDDIRLQQILVNILSNAVKFTKQGKVTASVFIDNEQLCFDVADTGIGIREDDLPFIFDEFNQLSSGVDRAIHGTGLGLPITKSLVEMMQGSLTVESEYGSGSVFHVALPLVLGEEQALPEDIAPEQLANAPEARVLVVDDNEINLTVATCLLQRFGIICDVALSGATAVAKVKEQRYDLIFMDHMMPEMDGVEATRLIRRYYDNDSLPIVALTANAVGDVREQLLQAGMNDYLSKPIDIREMNRVLAQWLEF